MKRTLEKDNEVINQYLRAVPYRLIAKALGYSLGTISDIVREWQEKLESGDSEAIKLLIKYQKIEEISPSEIARISRLMNKIKSSSIIQIVPDDALASLVIDFIDIVQKEKIDPSVAPILVRDMIEKLKALSKSARDRNEREQAAERKLIAIYRKTDDVIRESNGIFEVHSLMKKHGLSPQECIPAIIVIADLLKRGYDIAKVEAQFSMVNALNTKIVKGSRHLKSLEQEISKRSRLLVTLEMLEQMGLDQDSIRQIHDTIARTALANGMDYYAAAAKIVELLRNYPALLVYESQLKYMNQEMRQAEDECIKYVHYQQALDDLIKLRAGGYSARDIRIVADLERKGELEYLLRKHKERLLSQGQKNVHPGYPVY